MPCRFGTYRDVGGCELTTFSDLQMLIANANDFLITFDGILSLLQAELSEQSLLPGATPEATQDPIEYEKATDGTITYRLKQTTPNTPDGSYEGVYRLPLTDSRSVLELVSVVSHHNSASGAPAQVKAPPSEFDPTPSFVDLASVQALGGQELKCCSLFAVMSLLRSTCA